MRMTRRQRIQLYREVVSAIEAGREGVVRRAIEGGLSMGGRDALRLAKASDAEIPLVAAAKAGASRMVKLILESGADVNEIGRCGLPAIAVAAAKRKGETVAVLLEAGADIGLRKGRGKLSAICLAAYNGDLEMVKMLLGKGADANDVLKSEVGALSRIPGAILRELVEAGGEAPAEIGELLASGDALGDRHADPQDSAVS